MVKNKDNQNNFSIVEQICKKYFSEIENSVPHVQHVLFDLQNESYKMWKNTIIANISLQKEFMYNSQFNFVVPEPFKIFLENMSE